MDEIILFANVRSIIEKCKFADEKIKFSIKKSKHVSNLHPQTTILTILKSKYNIYILEL